MAEPMGLDSTPGMPLLKAAPAAPIRVPEPNQVAKTVKTHNQSGSLRPATIKSVLSRTFRLA